MGFIADMLKEVPLSAALRARLVGFEGEFEKLRMERDSLKRQLVDCQTENTRLKQEAEATLEVILDEEQRSVLVLLSSGVGELGARNVASALRLLPMDARHLLDQLADAEYVYTRYSMDSLPKYGLAAKGKEYLLTHRQLAKVG